MHYFITAFWIVFYRILSILLRKDEHSIVFGSWKGKSYTDNSRYLAEYIGENYPIYNLYWVGTDEIREEIENAPVDISFLEKDKFRTNIKIMKCKYCFVSQKYHVDIFGYNLLYNAVICYLHHGTPVKKWGDDGLNKRKALTWRARFQDILKGRAVDYDYYASSSMLNSEVLCSAMRSCGCKMDKIMKTGTPRNDMLVNYSEERALRYKKSFFDFWGIKGNPVVIMYLPTYRRIEDNVFSFTKLPLSEFVKIEALLERFNAILVEKSHFAAEELRKTKDSSYFFCVGKGVNVQEMLLFTDILISDYSGAFLDFSLLDRPIIHFAYDYKFFRDVDSGLYYEIDDFNAGAIAYDFESVCMELQKLLEGKDEYSDRRKIIRNKYMEYEQGHASENIFKTVVLDSQHEKSV